MPRIVAEPIEYLRMLWQHEPWLFVFTAPRFCKHWDGSWVGLTVWTDHTVYLDPRPSQHTGGIADTIIHEAMHIVRGPEVDLRTDEPFIAALSSNLTSILGPYRPTLPPLPQGIERLQRMCNRYRREREDE